MRLFTTRRRKSYPIARMLGWLLAGIPILSALALCCGVLGGGLGTYLHFSEGLPRVPDLRSYKPKTVSTFYANDGTVVGVFYKQMRFPVPLDSLPKHVVGAFLAAEDARFFSHTGVDLLGVIRAALKNLKAGNFAQGGSTITQQVTRNFLLSREKRLSRKVQEAILSFRLEKTLSKEQILEIYLNEIYLGKGCYGVESAARTYFGKTARDLNVAEAAMIAGFVSNPSKYSNPSNLDACLKRREYVLDNMVRYGFVSDAEFRTAAQETPKFRESQSSPYDRVPYFTEAVRQYIVQKYGENRLYNEGLQVFTTCDVSLQDTASDALVKGVKDWEKRQRRPAGLVRKLKASETKEFLQSQRRDSYNVGDVVRALVVETHNPVKQKGTRADTSSRDCTLALAGNVRVRMHLRSEVPYRPNQLLEFRVKDVNEGLPVLEHLAVPPVQGAVVCIENRTGYVKALVGGVDFERSRFNRAVQAFRQPGSAFKPMIYTAALEWGGYSPNTLIVDEPIAVVTDPRKGEWVPGNADGQYHGLMTLRDALAQSRNVAAIKLLMDTGLEPAVRMARRMGIRTRLKKNLSLCLGTSEVTPLDLTAAYTVFPNMGIRVEPVLVEKVKDRFGNVLEDNTALPVDLAVLAVQASFRDRDTCHGEPPSSPPFDDSADAPIDRDQVASREPQPLEQACPLSPPVEALLSGSPVRPAAETRPLPHRAFSPSTAYLMLSMLRKTCVSGTAAAVTRLKRTDLAGKTGTTDDSSDAWFVGFNPKYTTGVWVGYDAKVSLGRQEHGARAALPVWMDFMKAALANEPCTGYRPPEGIVFAGGLHAPNERNLGRFLEADPDRMVALETKPVCPIDASFVLASGRQDPLTSMPVMAMNLNGGSPSATVRILSPNGQDLGVGHYAMDEKGVMSFRRDWDGLTTETRDTASVGDGGRTNPFSPKTAGVQGLAQRMVDYLRQMGWYQ